MTSPRESSNGAALAEQLEKDLRFFQLLLLPINKSCPIENVDLVWSDTEPEVRAGLRQTAGTTQALQQSYSDLLRCEQTNPSPKEDWKDGTNRNEPGGTSHFAATQVSLTHHAIQALWYFCRSTAGIGRENWKKCSASAGCSSARGIHWRWAGGIRNTSESH
jgi:hypothetical protein